MTTRTEVPAIPMPQEVETDRGKGLAFNLQHLSREAYRKAVRRAQERVPGVTRVDDNHRRVITFFINLKEGVDKLGAILRSRLQAAIDELSRRQMQRRRTQRELGRLKRNKRYSKRAPRRSFQLA